MSFEPYRVNPIVAERIWHELLFLERFRGPEGDVLVSLYDIADYLGIDYDRKPGD